MNLHQLTKCFLSFCMLLFLAARGIAQDGSIVITGTVVDGETGAPVAGVTVSVKGHAGSVISTSLGGFKIRANSGETLTFTHVSFSTKEVKVTASSEEMSMKVSLDKGNNQLDDVVVVGYGTQKRAHLTGAVSTVDVKAVQDLPVANLSDALKGQVVGLSVSGGYARPGEPATITVRNPLYYSKDGMAKSTLYVIDNIIRSTDDFNLLDPQDIESISVLKDAAAAIYGIRGANGVIIVTTKRGKAGTMAINYSSSYGVTDAVSFPKMMSGYQQAQYMNDLNFMKNGYKFDSTKTDVYYPDELDSFKLRDYNWLDDAWQRASEMRQAISASGGTDKATYFAGFSYFTQNSNMTSAGGYKKYTFRASTDLKLATGLKLGLSLSGFMTDQKYTYSKQNGESVENDWRTLVTSPRFIPPTINGLPVWMTGASTSNISSYNYYGVLGSGAFSQTKNNGLNFQGTISYDFPFVKGLKATVNYDKNISNSFGKQYGSKYNEYSFNMRGGNKHVFGDTTITKVTTITNADFVRLNPTNTDAYTLNATLSYEKAIQRHQIKALFGYEQSESSTDGVAGLVNNVVPGAPVYQTSAYGAQTSSESASEFGSLAYFGRLDYNYANKYLLELQLRADASPNFAPENRWGYFPSVSAGWVISEEKFFNNLLDVVNYLKIRASAGHLGLDATKGYLWLRSYSLAMQRAAIFGGNTDRAAGIQTNVDMANRNVHWENVNKLNAGIDARFLSNRLSLSVDGFIDYRDSMLSGLTSAPSLLIGATLPSENFGKARTFGYEVTASWRDKINKDWSYNVTMNFNWMDNKQIIIDHPTGVEGTYKDPRGKSSDMGYLGYHAIGMFRSQEEVDAWLAKFPGYTIIGDAPKPGMLNYEDVRGQDAAGNYTDGPDGKITTADQVYLKPKSSNHYGLGINWGVAYKTVTLNVVMGMSWGGIDAVESAARKQASITSNRPEFWADHWTAENTNARYPAPHYSNNYDQPSDFWFRSSYQFNVSNFNLSYTLPARWTKPVHFNTARIYLIGTNPLSFYNPYSYKDSRNGSFDVFPTLKSYSLGVNLGL